MYYTESIKNWRIWLGSFGFFGLIGLFTAKARYVNEMHFNGQQIDNLALWLAETFHWYIPWVLLAPVCLTYISLIRFKELGLLRFLFVHFLIMASFVTTCALFGILMTWFFFDAPWITGTLDESIVNYLTYLNWHFDLAIYCTLPAVGYMRHYYFSTQEQLKVNQSLEAQLLKVELQALKSQLNPHFLFNTLNTISSLIRLERKQEATTALSELSAMLRTVLENQGQKLVTFNKEMDFIQSYLNIQKLRFGEKLAISVNCPKEAWLVPVPFMILQPLVENAVQHGSQLESDKNTLSLDVTLQQEMLKIRLVNRVPVHEEHGGFGIGTKNCRERLNRFYSDDFRLDVRSLPDRYFETILEIPQNQDTAFIKEFTQEEERHP